MLVLQHVGTYKDGGSKRLLSLDGKTEYWQDFGIGSTTKGQLYKGTIRDKSNPIAESFFIPAAESKTRRKFFYRR